MPGSADRIGIDIRGEGGDEERVREILDEIGAVTGGDGRPLGVELVPSSGPPPDGPLVVIGPDREEEMLAAVEDGAMGYLVASSSADEIEAALNSVASGAAVIPPMMLGALLRHTVQRRRQAAEVEERLEVLTERERQVVEQLSLGHPRKVIAQRFRISPETVRTHIQRAMAKLGVHSQNELMALLAPLERG